jgi:hypothetical protein
MANTTDGSALDGAQATTPLTLGNGSEVASGVADRAACLLGPAEGALSLGSGDAVSAGLGVGVALRQPSHDDNPGSPAPTSFTAATE